MITITRSLARQIRAVFRKGLGITPHGLTYPVTLQTGPGGLVVRAMSPDAAVEYYERCSLADAKLLVPFELLNDCEGRKPEPVQLEPEGDNAVVARWCDGNVPQILRYDVPAEVTKGAFPAMPDTLAENHAGTRQSIWRLRSFTDPRLGRQFNQRVLHSGLAGST